MKWSNLEIRNNAYALAFDFNALCDAETFVGRNLLAAFSVLGTDRLTAGDLRGLLYAAIRIDAGMPKEPDKLLEFCGGLMLPDTIGDIVMALGEAYALAVSDEEAERYRAKMRAAEEEADPAPIRQVTLPELIPELSPSDEFDPPVA